MDSSRHSRPPRFAPLSFGLAIALLAVVVVLPNHTPPIAAAPRMLTNEQLQILSHLSLVTLPDGFGGTRETIRVSGVNLQLVDGLGATNGNPSTPTAIDAGETVVNGLGNLIIGYDELHGFDDDKRGSHNLIVGGEHRYRSFGGLVVGHASEIAAPFASVSGGRGHALAIHASISGGDGTANAPFSSISGGLSGVAGGEGASVSGGDNNEAAGPQSAISGGEGNFVFAYAGSIAGGVNNRVTGSYASISGGGDLLVDGLRAWRACDVTCP